MLQRDQPKINSSKKVLILSLGRTGSLPVYAENIIANFTIKKFDIVISRNRFIKNHVENAIKIRTYNDKISFFFKTLIYLPFKFGFLLPKIYREYDVLYLPYQHFWDIPFILLFRILKRRVVFTIHDGILHDGEKNFISQYLTNIRMKNASQFIFLTSYVKNLVEDECKLFKESVIIPHPILENKFTKIKQGEINSKNLLFLGRIDKYKGVELLMRSAVQAENYFDKLIIAGKSQYKVKYVRHSKIEVKDKYLTEEEIGILLSWADILILPYTEATQSGVITLGIFAELPMICTRVGGFSEQLAEDECFWITPNEKDLILSIQEIFNNPVRYREIKMKLKNKKKELSWSKIAGRIENFLFV